MTHDKSKATRPDRRRIPGHSTALPTFKPAGALTCRACGVEDRPESGWQPVMFWYHRCIAFPCSWKLKCTLTYPPHVHGLLCR
jgi:hypothetical protein